MTVIVLVLVALVTSQLAAAMRSQARRAVGLARDDGAPPVSEQRIPLLTNLLDQVALALERI